MPDIRITKIAYRGGKWPPSSICIEDRFGAGEPVEYVPAARVRELKEFLSRYEKTVGPIDGGDTR